MLSNLGATSGGGVLGGGTHWKLIVGLGSFGFVSFLFFPSTVYSIPLKQSLCV